MRKEERSRNVRRSSGCSGDRISERTGVGGRGFRRTMLGLGSPLVQKKKKKKGGRRSGRDKWVKTAVSSRVLVGE